MRLLMREVTNTIVRCSSSSARMVPKRMKPMRTSAHRWMSTTSSFFFQAEDGIRAGHVTGVQTCALPIFLPGQLDPQDDFFPVIADPSKDFFQNTFPQPHGDGLHRQPHRMQNIIPRPLHRRKDLIPMTPNKREYWG